MAPAPTDPSNTDIVVVQKDILGLPKAAYERLVKAGVSLPSEGYPYTRNRRLSLQDVYNIRNREREHIEAGASADESKRALLSAVTRATDLNAHIRTKIKGLQLKDLTDQQRDELALLIAVRSVLFSRDQDNSPQQQKELEEYDGEVDIHVNRNLLDIVESGTFC